MAGVLEHVVPRERARPLRVGRGGRKQRLLDHELRAAIAAGGIDAAQTRGRDDDPRPARDARHDRAGDARRRDRREQRPLAHTRRDDRRDQNDDGRAGEARADDEADRGRVEPARREIEPEQHAEEARRRRAEEGGGVEPRAITRVHDGRPASCGSLSHTGRRRARQARRHGADGGGPATRRRGASRRRPCGATSPCRRGLAPARGSGGAPP